MTAEPVAPDTLRFRHSILNRVAAAILATALLVIAWQVFWTRRAELDEIRAEALAQVNQDMLSLQTNLDFALASGEVEQVNRELTARAVDPDVEALFLVDDHGAVVGSRLRHEVASSPEAAWGGALPTDMVAAATRTRSGQARLSPDGGHVIAVYPVLLARPPGEVSAHRVGVILARYSLERPIADALASVWRRSAEQILVAMAGVGALLLFGRISIGRRVRRLLDATEQFAGGNLNARADIAGDDEVALIGASFDAMARRVAEARRIVNTSEARFRALVEAAPVGVLLTDGSGRVIACNEHWRALVGDPAEDWRTALHEQERESVGRAWAEAVSTGRAVELECRLTRPDRRAASEASDRRPEGRGGGARGEGPPSPLGDRVICAQLLGFPQRAEADVPAGYVTIAVDLTQRREAEDTRLRLEARLAQAEKLEAVGVLASGVAHDFNNLLAAILGRALLLEEALGDHPAAAAHLRPLLRAAERGRGLVRQILAFGRPGLQHPVEVRLGPLLDEVAGLLKPELPSNVSLRTHVDPDLPAIVGDADQLHRLLLNLATNAWQAMIPKGGTLTLSLECVERERGRGVLLRVRDEGVGMDASTLARVFEPFFTSRPGSGTGLGLAVVHGIVRAHGGEIAVDSKPGLGTVFSVFLPSSHLPTPLAAEPAAPVAPAPVQGDVGGAHVLYVDDDVDLLELVAHNLGRVGIRVTTYSSPVAALAAYRANPDAFDLVVTDQRMPEMLGEDLAAALLETRADTLAVVVSGHVTPADEARMRSRGVHAVVEKPITAEQLAELCRRVLMTRALAPE